MSISSISKDILKFVPDQLLVPMLKVRYRNRPYLEFYRALMEVHARANPKKAVGGQWERIGPHQCEFLVGLGLRPDNTLLDIGCGSLRGGVHFIKYLDKGNYYGIDISPQIIEAAKGFIKEYGISSKQPVLKVNADLELNDFNGMKFDFLNAQSVLSHMPQEDIDLLFSNLHKVMHEQSRFIATFFEGDTYRASADFRNFIYPFPLLQRMGERYGLIVNKLKDPTFSRKQDIMQVTLASRRGQTSTS